MNITFRVRLLASLEVNLAKYIVLLTSEQLKKSKLAFVGYIVTNKGTLNGPLVILSMYCFENKDILGDSMLLTFPRT